MKETKTLTTFKCDLKGCKKKISNCEKFPYEKEWVYLYNFSFKLGHNVIPATMDKHFCCKEHLKEFLNGEVEGRLTALFG